MFVGVDSSNGKNTKLAIAIQNQEKHDCIQFYLSFSSINDMGMIARCEFTRFDTCGIIKFRVSLCIIIENENEKLSIVP